MGFSKWRSSKKTKENNGMTLSDVLRGIQHCVNAGREIVEQHHITALDKYFDQDGNPIVKQIHINDNYTMDLPLLCMSTHNAMLLDEMSIKMNVELRDMDAKTAVAEAIGEDDEFTVTRSAFRVELSNLTRDRRGNTHMDIEMKFKAFDPPEAVSRIVEQLNNSIATKIKQ